jgi:putative hydrolase of the HAD superfamily
VLNPAMRENWIRSVCLDFGDTLADESTEVKDETETTQQAELIPGAAEALRSLKRRGYDLALVADGRPGTYENVLRQHKLYDLFDVFSISELLGVEKPHRRMFEHALDQLGIPPEDYGRVVMVGNRLERDVRGANLLGLTSVWLNWSPRYGKQPADEHEVPDFEIQSPGQLLRVLDQLERRASPAGDT